MIRWTMYTEGQVILDHLHKEVHVLCLFQWVCIWLDSTRIHVLRKVQTYWPRAAWKLRALKQLHLNGTTYKLIYGNLKTYKIILDFISCIHLLFKYTIFIICIHLLFTYTIFIIWLHVSNFLDYCTPFFYGILNIKRSTSRNTWNIMSTMHIWLTEFKQYVLLIYHKNYDQLAQWVTFHERIHSSDSSLYIANSNKNIKL